MVGWRHPLGIEKNMIPRGIFPVVDEVIALEDRKPFEYFGESFHNYSSLDDDPEGAIALEGLVSSGFVRKFTSRQRMR